MFLVSLEETLDFQFGIKITRLKVPILKIPLLIVFLIIIYLCIFIVFFYLLYPGSQNLTPMVRLKNIPNG